LLSLGSDRTLKNGTLSYNDSSGNTFRCNGSQNTTIDNVTFIGRAPGLINLRNGASNITIKNCVFDSSQGAAGRMSQLIWLYDCQNIKVLNNTFISSGYGVITQVDYVSDDVLIDGNYIVDSFNDFVEANSANVKCKNWTITNNIYKGGNGWPSVETERRFVGITEVENVIVSDNIVENVCGDAAVHLEDLYGDCIVDGNIFENWVGNSCIYNLSEAKDCIISNNIFKRTEAVLMPTAISTNSGNYDHSLIITGNKFEDLINDADRFTAIDAAFSGNFTITNNMAKNCSGLCTLRSLNEALIANNKVVNCTAGILANYKLIGGRGTGSAGSDVVIAGNHIDVTDSDFGIYATANTSGTQGPKNWLVTGNHSNGNITLSNWSGSVGQTLWNVASGNYMKTGAVIGVSNSGGTGRITADRYGNFYEGATEPEGFSGTFTNGDAATVTVQHGLITSIV